MNALEVNKINKHYQGFQLKDVTFSVPQGTIVGFVGENGAGKSTTIHAILNLVHKDSGDIVLFGKHNAEIDFMDYQDIGVVFDGNNYPENYTPIDLNGYLENVYVKWDKEVFNSYLKRFSLPPKKKIKHFSKGMKMKLNIAISLSHCPKLLILDEPTSALDPIAREEILDVFLEFIQNDNNSILVSSHITSDLEKIADYIVFIHNGEIQFQKSKDELRYRYGILKCNDETFKKINFDDVVAYKKEDYFYQVLVEDKEAMQSKFPQEIIDPATIDEIMLLYVKGAIK